ncbi:MAG TPA: alpha/beta hydrolase [Cyanophyceae cyanobacterium]
MIHWLLPAVALLLSGAGFLLSCWIVIPAPTLSLLVLGVGIPEISPWLVVWNAIALGLSLVTIHSNLLQRLALSASLIGLILSLLPLIQLPTTAQRMAAAMAEGLGADYMARTSKAVQLQTRSHPFVLADVFRGIATSPVRYTPGIPFAAPDGVPLSMDIYQPLKEGYYPALVVIHGGGWQSGNPKHHGSFSRYMAARGYTVFAIAYRFAPRYQFPAQLDDVRAALAFIQKHAAEYEIDPNRIALLGRSAGGHLAMLTAYQPDALPVRAVVSYYGPFNLERGYREPPNPDPLNVRAVLEAFLGGSPDDVPEQYKKASPANYVKPSLPPTLLVHGSRDHVVQLRFARDMFKRLRAAENTSVLLEIPWAEHAFDFIFHGVSNQLALYHTERFLDWAMHSSSPPDVDGNRPE